MVFISPRVIQLSRRLFLFKFLYCECYATIPTLRGQGDSKVSQSVPTILTETVDPPLDPDYKLA